MESRHDPNVPVPAQNAGVSVYVNDRAQVVVAGSTLTALIETAFSGCGPGVAVAVDGVVVSRSRWAESRLAGGERVLLIQASQGG